MYKLNLLLFLLFFIVQTMQADNKITIEKVLTKP